MIKKFRKKTQSKFVPTLAQKQHNVKILEVKPY
jgi:hypothetical protein